MSEGPVFLRICIPVKIQVYGNGIDFMEGSKNVLKVFDFCLAAIFLLSYGKSLFFFHLIVSKFEYKPRNRIVEIILCLKIKYLRQKFFDIRQYYICTLILIWNLSFGMWCTCVVKIN